MTVERPETPDPAMSEPEEPGNAVVACAVRRLGLDDADAYNELRMQSLLASPMAFTTDAEAWRAASRETIEAHLTPNGEQVAVLGAFVGDAELVGLLGFTREARPAVSHKASLWGFYVDSPYRRRGIGRTLIAEAMNVAKVSGVRQLRAVVPTACDEASALLRSVGFEAFGLEREARLVDGIFHDQAFFGFRVPQAGN